MRFLQVFCMPFCLLLAGILRISGYWHFVVGWVVCFVRLCACYLVIFVGLTLCPPPLFPYFVVGWCYGGLLSLVFTFWIMSFTVFVASSSSLK